MVSLNKALVYALVDQDKQSSCDAMASSGISRHPCSVGQNVIQLELQFNPKIAYQKHSRALIFAILLFEVIEVANLLYFYIFYNREETK